ncbi:MAG: competence/damage-inducible protein A [Acidimicrobiia bacterium]|nr:competence/damage-inducible protein A [Acidimicrobiia bacterium]
MNVSVIAVGTELLLGQIINTNLATIGRALAEAGLDTYRQVVVGDNLARLAEAIDEALQDADAVIMTGGIGPTQDDITREAICAATGLGMAYSSEYAAHLEGWWASRGREMPETNYKQAEHPEGAVLIPNAKGTAPGLDLTVGDKRLFAMPGVPVEMKEMLAGHVIPALVAREGGEAAVLKSRLLRSYGLSESRVAELLADLFEAQSNPTVAFLASAGEIKVRLTAKAPTDDAADALIAPLEAEVRSRLQSVFGADDDTIEQIIFDGLAARGWSIGTAESATGGMIIARLTSVPGASNYVRGSVVSYATGVKQALLGVSDEAIEDGVVSEATALAMADGGRAALGADVVVAVTGSAGPDPQEQDVGTMVVAVATPERSQARTFRMPGDRERVRTYTTTAALHLVRLALADEWW